MKFTICAYFDIETAKYNPPFLVPFGLDECIESVIDSVKKGQLKDAEYFRMFHLGYYDTADAKFDLNDQPVLVADLTKYVKKA